MCQSFGDSPSHFCRYAFAYDYNWLPGVDDSQSVTHLHSTLLEKVMMKKVLWLQEEQKEKSTSSTRKKLSREVYTSHNRKRNCSFFLRLLLRRLLRRDFPHFESKRALTSSYLHGIYLNMRKGVEEGWVLENVWEKLKI